MTRFFSRLFEFRANTRSNRRAGRYWLLVEHLEDRTVPSAFVVNTIGDTVDALPGDGYARDAAGNTSLRAAVMEANALAGADAITFAPRVHGTITLDNTLGELKITDALRIDGPGANRLAVSGNDATRVFNISSGTVVTIEGLTITRGLAATNVLDLPTYGGGILNRGNLTLTDVVVSHNNAVGVAGVTVERHTGGGSGGGIANLGTLTVTRSTFVENQARGADGSNGAFFTQTGPPLTPLSSPSPASGSAAASGTG